MIITKTEQFYNFKPLEIEEPIFVSDIKIIPNIPGIYLIHTPNLEKNPYGGHSMTLWTRFNKNYKYHKKMIFVQ